MSRRDEPAEATVAALGRLLREGTEARERARRDAPELRRRDAATRQRLVEAMSELRRPRGDAEDASGRPRSGPVGAALSWLVATWRGRVAVAGVVALAACAVLWTTRAPVLDYTVGGAAEVAGYVRAEGGAATVAFEDGTVFELAPGASGRIGEVRSNGARFVLEDGGLDARVEKSPGAAWSVHAGPWEVRVTGTAFTVGWDARRRALRVAMREGSVLVHGPGAEAGIGLRAGQTLEVAGDGTIHVGSAASAAAAPATAEPIAVPTATAEAPSAVVAEAPAASAAVEPAEVARPWSARIASRDYDGVLADAEARGIDAVLGGASPADLSALADAARYRGRSGLATRALAALRDRFQGTAAAANAAFLLGRMADDAGSAAAAIRWYDVHLAEGGAFAAEALGRKMLAVRRSTGDDAAASVARTYLARFPGGAHASIARVLVGEVAEVTQPTPGSQPTRGSQPTPGAQPTPGSQAPREPPPRDPGVMPTSP